MLIPIAILAAALAANTSQALTLPDGTLQQTWTDLFYANWQVTPEQIRSLVPEPLEIDTFEGTAVVSTIAFEMKEMKLTGVPFGGFSSFQELNFRTYVRYGELRGIYLFSADVSSKAVVDLSRLLFPAPFLAAEMSFETYATLGNFHFDSIRTDRHAPPAEFHADLKVLDHFDAPIGSLENFVAERYHLFQPDSKGCVKIASIRHEPLQLWKVEIHSLATTLPQSIGLQLGSGAGSFYSAGAQTQVWPFHDGGCGRK